ncbi:glycosyltransferase [Bacillus sp. SJS]|uniref:glycosyltransferase n=1 Tax=Bacillus sp. SJS TaxID=1423321 RepID=UPI0004DCD299|nr:glycosyltransferase family 2 protein [Bacillus sp. SJS]KZZ83627.1 glycosyl transferase [Bacillus sp. SJS]
MATISLCMIVKDEEENLANCLQSIKGIPDEIIIADTGSKDQTKAIASEWTSKILDFKWSDNFSTARNYVFDQAEMDYILWLDADDFLTSENAQKLLALKETLDSAIDAVTMPYHILLDENNNVLSTVKRIRLVKRGKFRWHGYVHEDLAAAESYQLYESDIVVTHNKQEKRMDSDRNLRIYEKQRKKGIQLTPHDLFHYARELHKHKMYEKAVSAYKRFLAIDGIPLENRIYVSGKLASCYYHLGKQDKELEITLKTLEWDTPRPESCCRLGEHFLKSQQYSQAAFWYRLALEVPVPDDLWADETMPYKTWLPHKQLGLCYFHLGDYGKSLVHNRAVLKFIPNDPEVLQNIPVLEQLDRKLD